MELNSLRYFICVANYLSFSKAAQHLYISQPALSYHISNLEKELGVPLFIRDKRQISLTNAGQILLNEATQICEHVDSAYNKIAALSAPTTDTLRFAFLELLITPCFNQFISPFLNRYPSIHGVIERYSNTALLDSLLQKNTCDFAFTRVFLCDLYGYSENLSYQVVFHDSLSIVVPQNHPCARLDCIQDLSPLAGSPLLMLDKEVAGDCYDPCFKKLLQSHGFGATIPDYLLRNMDDLLGQVAAGRGISIVPFHDSIDIAYNGAKLIRLVGDDVPSADIVLAWNRAAMNQNKEQFLSYISEHAPVPSALPV